MEQNITGEMEGVLPTNVMLLASVKKMTSIVPILQKNTLQGPGDFPQSFGMERNRSMQLNYNVFISQISIFNF